MKKIFTVLLIVFAINLFCVDPGTSPALTYKRILFLESNSLTDTYKKLYDGGGLNLEGFEVPFKLKLTGMMFNDANELIFRESGSRINSYGVGLLNLLADSEIDLITLTLDINASSGVDISNDLVINGTTASTSYTTGSVIIDGGVGIAKDVYINEDLNVQEITNLDNTNIVGAVNIDATTYDIDASTSVDIDADAGTIRIGYASEARPITIGNATSETTVADNLTVTGNTAVGGTLNITGPTTTASLFTVGTVNIDATTLDIDATDDIDIDTSDTVGGIAIGTATSGVPISMGHTTSETTVNDNLTVVGNTTTSSITLGGTLVTSTGAELNILNGVTADKDELNILNGATVTTAELNLLDEGSTEAIYSNASAVKVRAGGQTTFNFDTTTLRPTGDGIDLGSSTFKFEDLYIDGTAYLDAIDLNGTAITASGAELNILDGVTADKDELNILNGVTATGAELNLLDAGSDEAVYDDASTVKVRVGGTTTFSFNTTALQPTGPGIDLGSSGAKFKDLYLDGDTDMGGTLDVTGATTTTAIQSVGAVNFDATTYDLDASTSLDIDAAAGVIQIGVNSEGRAVRIGNSTSETTIGDNLTVAGTLTQIGASDFTGLVTADALTATGTSTLSTVDINAGAIDGTTIGATDAATGAFTTLTTSEAYTAGSTVDLNGNELILDLDGDTSITADVDDRIDFKVGGTDELVLNASRLSPYTDGGLDLGKQGGEEFGSIFLAEDVDCEGDLVVGDDASIGGDATIDGALTVGAITTDGINYGNGITAIANTYLVTLSPALDAYVAGQMITMKPASDNSAGASTLNVNGLGAVTILTVSGAAPAAVDILATGISILVYNGTNFILINPATTCD